MVNISRAEAPSCCNHKFVKEPVCAFADQFTTVKAKRHREGIAMKGDRRPSVGLSTSNKMLHNYTLIPRDGTRRVDEGSAYQVRKYRLSAVCLPPKRDGRGASSCRGRIFTASAIHKLSQLERDGCGGKKGWPWPSRI